MSRVEGAFLSMCMCKYYRFKVAHSVTLSSGVTAIWGRYVYPLDTWIDKMNAVISKMNHRVLSC